MWIKPIPFQAVKLHQDHHRPSRCLVIGVALSSFSVGALLMWAVAVFA